MARQPRSGKIDSRTARLKLTARKQAYWHRMNPGLFLGYRRNGKLAGVWICRQKVTGQKRYEEKRLGTADDFLDANGTSILDFQQAHRKALESISAYERDPKQEAVFLTVDKALQNYFDWYCGSRAPDKCRHMASKLNLIKASAAFKDKLCSELTSREIEKWHHAIVKQKTFRGHGRKGKKTERVIPNAEAPGYRDFLRRRKCTANSYLSILKSALNRAWRQGAIRSNDSWARVRPFPNVSEARIRFLSLDEIGRLLNSTPLPFGNLVRAALLTGARYGELTGLRVSDYLPDSQTVHFPAAITKNGKSRAVPLTAEGTAFFDGIAAGRKPDEALFLKVGGTTWVRSEQGPHMRRACKAALIEPAIGFHILRHSYASLLVQNGTPLQVVTAALGHSDGRITEKHYAHLAPSFVADTVRANLPVFGISSNVVPISRARHELEK